MAATASECHSPKGQQGPAESASHHDETRSAVPSTSIATCWMRAAEAKKPACERIVFDPFAERLCGGWEPDEAWLAKSGHSREFWTDMGAVRTRWADDALLAAAPTQLVILGTGLDSRACRLEVLRGVPVFELDFAEVLDAKWAVLGADAAIADLRKVPANLGLEDWVPKLQTAGFAPEQPSAWLLEGLTGYLTPEELEALLQRLSAAAAPGSTMVATFVGDRQKSSFSAMHRTVFRGEAEVEALLARHGWAAAVATYAGEAARHGRAASLPPHFNYYFATASRLASPALAEGARAEGQGGAQV